MPAPTPASPADASAAPSPSLSPTRLQTLLQTLWQAPQPLSLKALFGRTATLADKAHLRHLLASGAVVNLAKPPAVALVAAADAAGRFAPLQLARAAVLAHLGLSLRPLAVSTAGLAKVKLLACARPQLRPAIAQLVADGQVLPLKVGASSVVVALAGVQRHLAQLGAAAVPVPATPVPAAGATHVTHFTHVTDATLAASAALRQAYAAVRRPGASMVEIGALQRHLGWPLEALHAALGQLVAQGQGAWVRGEPSVLPQADRAAALLHAGQSYCSFELLAS